MRVVQLTCPSCGASVDENQKTCSSCGVGLLFELDDSGTSLSQIRMLIEQCSYEEAIQKCNAFISRGIRSADVYYCLCIALLEGKRPFLHSRNTIDKCINALENALKLDDKGIINLLRAFIEYDYFERKYLNRNPDYSFYLKKAQERLVNDDELAELETLLNNKINIWRPS